MSILPYLLVALFLCLGPNVVAVEPTTTPKKGEVEKKAETAKNAEITNPQDALAEMPRDVMKALRSGGRGVEEATTKATAQVGKNLAGKTGKLTVIVTRLEKFQRPDTPDVNRTRIWSTNGTVHEGGATFKLSVLGVVVDKDEKEKLARIKEGSKVTFTGPLNGEITMSSKGVLLHLHINDAKLVD